jgi:hypothetical protein
MTSGVLMPSSECCDADSQFACIRASGNNNVQESNHGNRNDRVPQSDTTRIIDNDNCVQKVCSHTFRAGHHEIRFSPNSTQTRNAKAHHRHTKVHRLVHDAIPAIQQPKQTPTSANYCTRAAALSSSLAFHGTHQCGPRSRQVEIQIDIEFERSNVGAKQALPRQSEVDIMKSEIVVDAIRVLYVHLFPQPKMRCCHVVDQLIVACEPKAIANKPAYKQTGRALVNASLRANQVNTHQVRKE